MSSRIEKLAQRYGLMVEELGGDGGRAFDHYMVGARAVLEEAKMHQIDLVKMRVVDTAVLEALFAEQQPAEGRKE